ncbi:MAG: ABC transporter substrate-binding protein [Atopobiaceae bacterium]|nr:ABC transporter substrate-binding protein [Atopobiaceae bacterium]
MSSFENVSRRKFVELFGAGTVAVSGLALGACGGANNGGSSEASTSAGSAEASASASGSGASSAAGVFKIGGIGPVTGAAAIYGNATKYGAQVAVDEVNAEGTIAMELNWQDDEHDPEKSVNAYNTLKDWGMQILVGTTTTGPCVAVSTETNSDRIFQLTPSASSTDVIGGQEDENGNVTIARKDNVFQMCFTDPNQGTASAKYIHDQNLGTKIAVIYNNSDAYSTGIYNKFQAEAKTLGLEIVSTTTFTDDSATDFNVQLNDAKDAGADLVFLPIYYTPASLILTQANAMGFAPKFFGVDGMDGILSVEGFDTSLAEDVMLLTPFVATAEDDLTKSFVESYKGVASEEPNQFAADAYDCVKAIAAAVAEAGVTADMDAASICESLVQTFTSSSFSYSGLTGENMSWKDTGEVTKDPKGMVIKNGVYESMD